MKIERRAVLGLGLAAAGLAAGAAAEGGQAPAGVLEVEGDGQGRYAAALADIRAYAARHMEVYGLPGLTLAVVGPDGLTALMRFGYAETETRTPLRGDHLFQVGSISKSFTALCIFQLIEAGKLGLDTDLRDLLPGAPLPAGKTSVQSLLNHSSGLPDDAPLFPRGGDGRLWRGFEPGTQWSYSNLGFLMLGMVAERLDGRPLPEVIRQRVLLPLGMTATRPAILTQDRMLYAHGYSPLYLDRGYPRAGPLGPAPWTDMTAGSGCVASTGHDMALYLRYLIAAGRGRGAPLLSDAGAARFTRPTIDAPGWAIAGSKYANGLAVVQVGGRDLLHHTGGMLSFNSAIHADPRGAIGAFASTNVGLVPYRPRDITAFACERLRAATEGAASPAPLAEYLGRYEGRGGRPLVVSEVGRTLSARIGDEAVAMDPSAPDVFVATAPQALADPLVFRRDGPAVTRAWLGGAEFVRVSDGRRVASPSPPTPESLARLTGWYRSDDPWAGSFRVVAHGEALFLQDGTPLTPLADGGYRVGDKDWSPERLRFDAVVEGRPQRAILSGVDHVRRPA